MGAIFLAVIYLVLGIVFTVVGVFFKQIIFFDSLAVGIVSGVCCKHFTSIHPAICLVIGIVIFFLLLVLQMTNVGFWVIGGLFTLFYSTVAGIMSYLHTGGDIVWIIVTFCISFFIIACLHLLAREDLNDTNQFKN